MAIGIPCRFLSFRAGSAWSRYGGSEEATGGVTSRVVISAASDTAGSNASGTLVNPYRF
jgi:hypothetical protein